MGAASSRPLQKLPKTLRNELKPPSTIPNSAATTPNPVVDDLPNPTLLSNLAQLGQVSVQNPAVAEEEAFRTTPTPFSLSPTASSSSSSSPAPVIQSRNTLSAPALSFLLDALKSDQPTPTLAHAKHLVQQHNLDWDVYQRLAKYVNSPTIGRQFQFHLSDNSVRLLKEAIWVDLPYT